MLANQFGLTIPILASLIRFGLAESNSSLNDCKETTGAYKKTTIS